MDPTSFHFVLTMPGDTRLVDTIRGLTTQAGSYAKLESDVSEAFAQKVADVTKSAIAATGVQDAPIEFRFKRQDEVLRVTITWSNNGSMESREIQQHVAS